VGQIKAFYLGYETNIWHGRLWRPVEEARAILLRSWMFGQQVITLFQCSTTDQGDGTFLCTSTYQDGASSQLVGSGPTMMEAYDDWMEEVQDAIERSALKWSPEPVDEEAEMLIRFLTSVSDIESPPFLRKHRTRAGVMNLLRRVGTYFSTTPTRENRTRGMVDVKSGKFYNQGGYDGWGAECIITKQQFDQMMAKKDPSYMKLPAAVRRSKWRNYKRKQGIGGPPRPMPVKRRPPRGPRPPRQSVFGATRKQNRSEIGTKRPAKPPPSGGGLSLCAQKYAVAVVNPLGWWM